MAQVNIKESFKEFQKQQRELADVIKNAAEITGKLGISKDEELTALSTKLHNDSFKIMVTGTFKNGKSTVINALLGEEVLPAYAVPCTAIINEIKYGQNKEAVLYFLNPRAEELPKNLAAAAVEHMNKYQGRNIPTMVIPYREIEDYVVIPMGADEKQTKMASPYEKLELMYPLELLQNGVEIIDSPGLNEDMTRTKVTNGYLNKVDAILYILNANQICALDEMNFIEDHIKGNEMDSIFFVVNRIDTVREREQKQVIDFAQMKLNSLYSDSNMKPEVYPLSAINALDGRLDSDEAMVNKSGIVALEKRLTEFLTKEKGKAKLLGPAKQVRNILNNEVLTVQIPKIRALLEDSVKDLEKKYAAIQPRLIAAEKARDQKAAEMDNKIQRAGRRFERLARHKLQNIVYSIPEWVDAYKPVNDIGFIPGKKDVEKVAEEIAAFINQKISSEMQEWQRTELSDEIETQADFIFQAAEHDFSKIFEEIDKINISLIGKDYSTQTAPFWERVAGAAGGLIIGDIALATSGGINGIGKEFVKTAAFQIAGGTILAFLSLFNPITLIALLGASIFYNMTKGSSAIMIKLKKQISEQAVECLEAELDNQTVAIAEGIEGKFNDVQRQIVASVSKEIDDLRKQMELAIEEKRSKENKVNERKQELIEIEEKIQQLNERIDKIILAV